MSEKVYEMDDNYNQAMEKLLEHINERDELAEALPHIPSEKRREARELLDEMNKKIEKVEAALAKEYASFQKMRRAEEERDVLFDEILDRTVKIYIHIKHNHPQMEPDIKEKALAVWEGREEEFFDRVAMYEADKTEFEKIIAREER